MESSVWRRDRAPVQLVAGLVGIVFLIVGIAGFIPGITTHLYRGLHFAGHHSRAQILHVFQTSWLHNIVHLAFGVVGLSMASTWAGARTYLIGGGVIYLGLWLYGIIVGTNSNANFVPLDRADDWLHLLLGVVMIGAGFVTTRAAVPRERPAT
jgi:hypothetical protein